MSKHHRSNKAGVRKTRTRNEQRAAKARNARRVRPMSRSADLKVLVQEITAYEAEIKGITEKYQKYATEVGEVVKAKLVAVGLWDEIHALEVQRMEVQKVAQEKVNKLAAARAEKLKIQEFLTRREMEDAPAPAAEASVPVAGTPAAEVPVVEEPAPVAEAPVIPLKPTF